jgi:hypothetical protein
VKKNVKNINSIVTKWEHKKGLFLNFSNKFNNFINKSGTKTFSRLSGITVKISVKLVQYFSWLAMLWKIPYNFI